jgi:hypothetical protein
MSIVTLPRAGIPIGTVSINGQQVPVSLHPEFQRYFETLFVRTGGATGAGNEELTLSQFEDAGIEESKAFAFALADEMRQQPRPIAVQIEAIETMISDLASVVAELSKAVDAINQGVIQ